MTIRIKNRHFEWRINDNGTNAGFYDIATGQDHLIASPVSPAAYILKNGWRADATKARMDDGVIEYTFGRNVAKAKIRARVEDDYVVFTVLSVEGDVDELDFINIPTDLKDIADEPFSATSIALGLKSNVEDLPGPQSFLWTAAYKRFGFEGAETGLVACSFAEMREALKAMVGAALGVPHSPNCGPWAMDSKLPTYSNIMNAPTPQNVDEWIDLCHRLGLKAIEFNGTLDYGSYRPRPDIFPNGYEDVRKLVKRFNDAGIVCGLHTMSFSIAKNCTWVTPVPDPRLAKEGTYTLASNLTTDMTDIPLVEDPSDLPPRIDYFIRRSMTLQIDDELIEYTAIKTEAPYAVLKCKRGACGTEPATHMEGAPVYHLKECWGCFVPDGETSLFTEVADKISTAVNECGFDFVYLDGLDGAHVIGGEDARWHYGAKFTFEVFRGLKRPIMMEMATFHHHLWYVRSCMQAWDHAVRDHKTFTDLHAYSNGFARKMFLPLHLGWVGLFPWCGQQNDPTFWDGVEYLWSKALATDAHLTLQMVTPHSLSNGAWLRELAPRIWTYEELRRVKYFDETIKARLAKAGDEFRLCQNGDGWGFEPIQAERHQIDDLESRSNIWNFTNKFATQPLALRIQSLPTLAEYDAEDAIELIDFKAVDDDGNTSFIDPGDKITIRNSGKLYIYPSAAPGMTGGIKAVESDGPVKNGGLFSVSRSYSDGLVLSSSLDDRYSLYDHFERMFKEREASWLYRHIDFEEKDLSKHQGFGLWIKGDGKGEVLDFAPICKTHGIYSQHYFVTIDFTGWRYVELLTPSTAEYEKQSWPFALGGYTLYRGQFNYARTLGFDIWCGGVAKGDTVECLLSPIKALPQIPQPIVNPVIAISGRQIVFPVSLEAGQYLEYYGGQTAKLYAGNGDLLCEVKPEGVLPEIAAGENTVSFQCQAEKQRPHARVTLFTKNGALLDESTAPAWDK